ncbi:hypothetical protein DPMN_089958 [Dreissena polymorpha]|uniref:Uncharacterized protein n=1 Tax=Dreissena polymorpha TaxID=45954 RepID=A0A9D4KXD0_DREPO|nr:hypothetical protein DPMN_089958 [Dreissena polymorpha]
MGDLDAKVGNNNSEREFIMGNKTELFGDFCGPNDLALRGILFPCQPTRNKTESRSSTPLHSDADLGEAQYIDRKSSTTQRHEGTLSNITKQLREAREIPTGHYELQMVIFCPNQKTKLTCGENTLRL